MPTNTNSGLPEFLDQQNQEAWAKLPLEMFPLRLIISVELLKIFFSDTCYPKELSDIILRGLFEKMILIRCILRNGILDISLWEAFDEKYRLCEIKAHEMSHKLVMFEVPSVVQQHMGLGIPGNLFHAHLAEEMILNRLIEFLLELGGLDIEP